MPGLYPALLYLRKSHGGITQVVKNPGHHNHKIPLGGFGHFFPGYTLKILGSQLHYPYHPSK